MLWDIDSPPRHPLARRLYLVKAQFRGPDIDSGPACSAFWKPENGVRHSWLDTNDGWRAALLLSSLSTHCRCSRSLREPELRIGLHETCDKCHSVPNPLRAQTLSDGTPVQSLSACSPSFWMNKRRRRRDGSAIKDRSARSLSLKI